MDEHPPQTVEEVAESEGSAAIDLDVLAVADDRKLALLVADILDDAVAAGREPHPPAARTRTTSSWCFASAGGSRR